MNTAWTLLAASSPALACLLVGGGLAVAEAQDVSPARLAAMKAEYRRPAAQPIDNQALVGLGRDLFFARKISASGNTACASCHFPELGWAVAEATSRSNSGKPTSRKSQPLAGIGHAGAAPVGWDGRSDSLEAQIKASISTGSMSMKDVKVETIEERLRADEATVARFAAALPGKPINLDSMATAIAAFERTLEPGTAPFDRWIDGDEQAISEQAKRGFVLFNGSTNCFACHSGWRFTDDKFHDIGTTTTDPGRGRVVKDDPLMQFAFKTPTLRSVALRPPYMHNGSQATLTDVLKHYETGGIDRPSRSPLMMPIVLSDQDRADLVAFLETLSEGARRAEAKPRP